MSLGNIIAGSAFIKLALDDAVLQRSLNESQGKLKRFAASVNAFSSNMASMAPMIAYPVVAAVKSFAEFDDQMSLTAAITKSTAAQFKELSALAAKLGRETSFTAAQVASGMVSLARMGFSPDEIKNAIKNVMDLSRSTKSELPDAAQIAANNLRVFGLEAKDMAHVADILSATANGSAQDLIDLGESLKMAGPHAKRAGADITETAAALGILANMGIRGSLAGTALGKSYKRLADPKVREFLEQYNIQTVDAANNLRSMRDILLDLSRVMASMGSAEQITFAEQVFDARGSLGGGTLSVNVEGIDKFLKSLDEASGYADKVAKDMDNRIGGALRRLSSAAEGFINRFGAIVSVTFGPLIESSTTLLGRLQEIVSADSNIVAATLKVISTFVGLGVAIKTVTILGSAVKGMLAPIAMLDAAIASLAVTQNAAAVSAGKLSVALTFLAKHPVMIAFLALSATIGIIAHRANMAKKELNDMADSAQKAADARTAARVRGDGDRKSAVADMERLRQLEEISQRTGLSAERMKEAQDIFNRLDPFGAAAWANIDTLTGKILLAADAQKKLNEELKKAAMTDLENEIAGLAEAIEKHKSRLKKGSDSEFGAFIDSFLSEGLGITDTISEHNAPILEEIKALEEKYYAAKNRLVDLQNGQTSAATGEKGNKPAPADIDAAQRRAALEDVADAEKRIAEIDEENARKKRTNLENQIYDLQKLREEYRKNIDLLLEEEKANLRLNTAKKNTAEAKKNKKNIEALEARRAAAEKDFADREKEIRQKEAQRIADNEKKFTDFLPQLEAEQKHQDQIAGQDDQFNRLNKDQTAKGIRMLNDFLAALDGNLDAAKARYQSMLTQFQDGTSDGGTTLTRDEQQQLSDMQQSITEAAERLRSYRDRISDGAKQAGESQKTLAAFDASALTSIFSRDGLSGMSREERIAKATEDTARSAKKIVQYQKNSPALTVG